MDDMTTVWYGDTQLTGLLPVGLAKRGITDVSDAPQSEFYGAVLTQKPTHKTPQRRMSTTQIPQVDGSVMTADNGYGDSTSLYKFAIDLAGEDVVTSIDPSDIVHDILPPLRTVRAFEHALTGHEQVRGGRKYSIDYKTSDARWEWLVDTCDNPGAIGPRPALNIASSDAVDLEPDGTRLARLAIYTGGDRVTIQRGRIAQIPVKFQTQPQLYTLKQAVVENPVWGKAYDAGIRDLTDKNAIAFKGKPIVLLQWTGTMALQRINPNSPMAVNFRVYPGLYTTAATLEYYRSNTTDSISLNALEYGMRGIGWDFLAEDYITGPAVWRIVNNDQKRLTACTHGEHSWTDDLQTRYVWINLQNCQFVGEGRVFLSVIYADSTQII